LRGSGAAILQESLSAVSIVRPWRRHSCASSASIVPI
jgi:hypothetical protein